MREHLSRVAGGRGDRGIVDGLTTPLAVCVAVRTGSGPVQPSGASIRWIGGRGLRRWGHATGVCPTSTRGRTVPAQVTATWTGVKRHTIGCFMWTAAHPTHQHETGRRGEGRPGEGELQHPKVRDKIKAQRRQVEEKERRGHHREAMEGKKELSSAR